MTDGILGTLRDGGDITEETLVKKPDLRGADLRDANLEGANLEGANLCNAKLGRANLEDAKLGRAKLRGAKLGRANLCNADLRHADLRGAKLLDANFRGTNLEGANLEGANLKGANLRNADLKNAKFDPAPKVQDLAARILAEVEKDPSALEMRDWHCGTAHCLAGWSVALAGEEGYRLEAHRTPGVAGTLIWVHSEEVVPDFYADNNDAALKWLRGHVSGGERP